MGKSLEELEEEYIQACEEVSDIEWEIRELYGKEALNRIIYREAEVAEKLLSFSEYKELNSNVDAEKLSWNKPWLKEEKDI